MKWLFGLWLMFAAACAVAIAIGRLDHTPNTLQALGFGLCKREACFKGIKVGTDWQTARVSFTQAIEQPDLLDIPINTENIRSIYASSQEYKGAKVYDIYPVPINVNDPKMFSTSIGAIVLQYGVPCR